MMRRVSFLVFILCIAIAFKNNTKKPFDINRWNPYSYSDFPMLDLDPYPATQSLILSVGEGEKDEEGGENIRFLEYDFYRDSCSGVEDTVRALVRHLYKKSSDVAPTLLRLVFHDCFVEGCDASVLLDDSDNIDSEKNSPPNESLKGFDIIDIIKEQLEKFCPGVVSCADILVLAAREAVVLAGGPFYPLFTGRRDSTAAFSDTATFELPAANADLSEILASFASRGFDSRETVSLLAVSPNFHTSLSSPTTSLQSLEDSLSLSPKEPEVNLTYDGPESGFGTAYYHRLLQNRGIFYADQQLMDGEETGIWVRVYASNVSLFRRDFALAMMKLSNLGVLTGTMGQIRLNCSRVA